MLAGLDEVTSGRIMIGGRVLFDSARGISIPVDQRGTGYVFQDARLFSHLKVSANLAYGERLRSARRSSIDRDRVVDTLGIGNLLDRWPATLSGGETRRVAIARAVLASPRFLLLDEPLSSLDQSRGMEILAMIEHLGTAMGVPMVYVSHQREETARLTDTVLHLSPD